MIKYIDNLNSNCNINRLDCSKKHAIIISVTMGKKMPSTPKRYAPMMILPR